MNDHKQTVWLLIPAFNVEDYIIDLLAATSKFIPAERTLVVDDGSTDQTLNRMQYEKVHLISIPENRGKGIALRKGFDYLKKQNASWVITIDADLQHDPSILPDFIKHAERGEFDMVIGMRDRCRKMPWDRRFSNWSTSLLLSIVTGYKIWDAQCGYRLIQMEKLNKLTLQSKNYDLETELLLKFSKLGAKVGWQAIPTIYRGASSSMKRGLDTFRFVRLIIKSMFS